jgi:opacity protein-like surface antigen
MQKRFIIVFTLMFLLAMCFTALAQSSSTPRDTSNHWEIELHGGGVFSGTLGDDTVACTDVITTTCNTIGFAIGPNGENVPTPLMGSLPQFMQNGQVHPGTGFNGGVRVGYDITPRWQVEFTWDYNHAPIEYNQEQIQGIMSGILVFCDPALFNPCSTTPGTARNIVVTDHSKSGGHENSYMFNVNYQWNTDRKFVPYVTVGVGAVDWSAGASFLLVQTKPGNRCDPQTANPDCRITFLKRATGDMGFGMNFGAGAKYYFNKNWGVRGEVKDTISWVDFTHTFASVDVDGDDGSLTPGSLIPPSGTGKQGSSPMNQLNVSGGLFFRF